MVVLEKLIDFARLSEESSLVRKMHYTARLDTRCFAPDGRPLLHAGFTIGMQKRKIRNL